MKNYTANSKNSLRITGFYCSRNDIILVLKNQYSQLTKTNLKVFGVSTRYLKDFVTTERDLLRKITRMPNNEYRLWEENLLPEEGAQTKASQMGDS